MGNFDDFLDLQNRETILFCKLHILKEHIEAKRNRRKVGIMYVTRLCHWLVEHGLGEKEQQDKAKSHKDWKQ